MPDHQELKNQARTMARSVLSNSPSFLSLERAEQMSMYKDMVDTHYTNLAEQYDLLSEQSGLATAMAKGEKASDYINKKAGDPRGVAAAGMQEMASGMKRVDFPSFVRDLLVGVFQANQDANDRQQEAFVRLVKQLTQSYTEIIKTQVDAQDALGRLVQNDPRFKNKKYRVRAVSSNPQPVQASASNPQPVSVAANNPAQTSLPTLVDEKGNVVKDAAVQGAFSNMLMDMAKEYRALLREMLLMGVSRLVVERGVIRATADFKVETKADQKLTQIANVDTTKTQSNTVGIQPPKIGFLSLFSGNKFERTSSITIDAHSEIDSTSNKSINSEAKVTGFVEIEFKSDYFKLDNFLQIMDLGKGQIPTGPPGKTPTQVPGGATPSQPLPAAATPAPDPAQPT